ncbi:VOC family protein [Natronospirillum operosum]|uniref:VOC family protein n=2 Tax=Natronospirillum operosum TaxID=2759953 RepID=A0A4Z0WBF6_9GAMM|nr:VOC family protein [Natronospirillum operosum]
MNDKPIVLSLPIADRKTAFSFYRGLNLEPLGELGRDGLPEPLQFRVNPGLHIMLVPTVGFGWIIGNHEPAPPGASECVLGITTESRAEVDELIARAEQAGGHVVSAPADQPWGYTGSFSDPDHHLWMVVSQPEV